MGISCHFFSSLGRVLMIAWFIALAPWLPPMTRMVFLPGSSGIFLRTSSLFPWVNSDLMGFPLKNTFLSGKNISDPGKETAILVASLAIIWLARPGMASDSWITIGILYIQAAATPGTPAKPPL